jgi:HD-like signal output (HDOD) protein
VRQARTPSSPALHKLAEIPEAPEDDETNGEVFGAAPADLPNEGAYTAWLFGAEACREAEPSALERDILERVDALSRAEGEQGLLPRMPSTLPKLLGLLRRDDVSVREIADALSHDPALLGEVIRIANSPYYWPSRRLVSVEDAVSVIGQEGLQQLVARVLVGPVFSVRQGHYSRAACGILWGQSERCAHACAWLRRGYADSFDAYLAGMVANAGLIAAARVLDLHFPAGAPPDSTGFHRELLAVSARVSASLARRWRFSDAIKAVLAERASAGESAPQSDLGRALIRADRLSKRHVMLPPRAVVEGSEVRLPRLVAEDEGCYRELERAFAP